MTRRSQTLEERRASLRYNIRDAEEALRNAANMRNWAGVIKYATELRSLEQKLVSAEGARPRIHRVYETMQAETMRRKYPETPEEKWQKRAALEKRGWSFSSPARDRRR
jgi:hypothetical protein